MPAPTQNPQDARDLSKKVKDTNDSSTGHRYGK